LLRGVDSKRDVDKLFGPDARKNRNSLRDQYLNHFRSLIIGLPGIQSKGFEDDRTLWALGRHHGLVTPLLDWTLSPYIALFFACFDHVAYHNKGFMHGTAGFFPAANVSQVDDVAVWELAYKGDMIIEDQFEIFEYRVDQAYRQKAQQGMFSLLTHHVAIDLESYLKEQGLAFYLTRYEIPGGEIGRALWNLRLMNIRYASLFPDIDGAAIEANTAYALNQFMDHYPLPEKES
jgi:hypothetical protein